MPKLAKLALGPHPLNRLRGALDLIRVRLMRVFADPTTDVVGQALGHLAGTRSRQLGSRHSLASGIELEVIRLSESVIQRGRDHKPGFDRLLHEVEPLARGVVLKASATPGSHRRTITRTPAAPPPNRALAAYDAAKESNLPSRGLPGPASFEDWMGHQARAAPAFRLRSKESGPPAGSKQV